MNLLRILIYLNGMAVCAVAEQVVSNISRDDAGTKPRCTLSAVMVNDTGMSRKDREKNRAASN